jgi:hypothetical protein
MPLAPPIPITEFTPPERPDPYDFAALDVLSQPAWRFEKGAHYERTEDHLLKWARRYAEANGLTMRYRTVRDANKKVLAVEIAFTADGGLDGAETHEDRVPAGKSAGERIDGGQ